MVLYRMDELMYQTMNFYLTLIQLIYSATEKISQFTRHKQERNVCVDFNDRD